jgi:hypothetical protein
MDHLKLESELRSRIKRRRIAEAVIASVFFAVAIVFLILREQSKIIEEVAIGPLKHTYVTYNDDFSWGILVGMMVFIPALIYLIGDCVFSKVITFNVNNDYITFYRGTLYTNLYVNGEYRDGIIYGYYLEADLSDGTRVNVAVGKWSAHVTFSNGYPPIDI